MSKYINSLFKGFFRSAINQVGRDGGRVISNKVYKDKHSIPVRSVSNTNSNSFDSVITPDDFNNKSLSINEENRYLDNIHNLTDRSILLSEGYKPEVFSQNPINYILIGISSILISLFYPLSLVIVIYWFYIGINNLMKRSVKFYAYEQIPVFKEDRRFKSGKRLEGYEKSKVYHNGIIMPTSGEKSIFVLKGLFALLLSMGFAFFIYNMTDEGKVEILDPIESNE